MEKIDAHVHVFSRHSMTFLREVSRLAPADKEATAEQLLTEMDAGGIGRAVLIQMSGTRIEHHGYVTQCVEKWPDRFTAVGLIDVHDPDPPARLEELVNSTGVKGIRVGDLGDPQAKRAEDLRTYGLFRHADELGININVYAPSTQLHGIELLVRAFPRVQISLDHLGI